MSMSEFAESTPDTELADPAPAQGGAAADRHARGYAQFIAASPSSYHAAAQLAHILEAHGFTEQRETEPWEARGARYVRRGGALIAWVSPRGAGSGELAPFRILGAHTDSPSLKLKPAGTSRHGGYTQVDMEVYGGPLLNSWLNRDLGLAGRVTDMDGREYLVRTPACMVIPQLAPHLISGNRDSLTLDRQQHLHPIVTGADAGFGTDTDSDLFETLARYAQPGPEGREAPGAEWIGWHDIYAYDVEPPRRNGAYLSAGRQDNLSSVYAGLRALLDGVAAGVGDNAALPYFPVFAAFDHEEVGSGTTSGASGPFLEAVLTRIAESFGVRGDSWYQLLARSACLSADAGHALNPNYAEFYDPDSAPRAGAGPLIKMNAQQRYASDAASVTLALRAASDAGAAYQFFISRNSIPCGTTIGPLTATRLGITTVDVGVPLLSMHSARELSHVEDLYQLRRLIRGFLFGERAADMQDADLADTGGGAGPGAESESNE
ncbi:M18 family aminopeptidase [Actinotignum sanguinis]|nr:MULTISPECIES: M18 family aminopeptidase [Actinotignum]MDK8748606.1 M18 family aminopeptidase [Actinotignum sanguinis]MDV2437725.1 M18 family aminopeptidase [Actinotignum sanguinis]WPJ88331.1 M18 family aminopeptidase [Schaalia turicensis]